MRLSADRGRASFAHESQLRARHDFKRAFALLRAGQRRTPRRARFACDCILCLFRLLMALRLRRTEQQWRDQESR